MVEVVLYEMNVYDYPKYYEIAFSYRDIKTEFDFIEYLIKKYSKVKVKQVLELACGTSPYMDELHKRGYGYLGIDLNSRMIKYTRTKALANSYKFKFLKANLINFKINNFRADLALTLLGSLYVDSKDEVFEHLNAVHQVLSKGGLYILNDIITQEITGKKEDKWTIIKNGIKVTTTYKSKIVSKKNRLQTENLVIKVNDGGMKKEIKSQIMHKYFLTNELKNLIGEHGKFEVVSEFSNFSIYKMDGKDDRPILVLRKL